MLVEMNNTRLKLQILIILDFRNYFFPTYLQLCCGVNNRPSFAQKVGNLFRELLKEMFWHTKANMIFPLLANLRKMAGKRVPGNENSAKDFMACV